VAEIALFKVARQEEFARLARKLKSVENGQKLQRRLTRNVRRAGQPALTAVKRKWHSIDVRSEGDGGERSGLRARADRATIISVTGKGIRIRTIGRRVDPRYPSLAFYLNGLGNKGWRYPVFGNRKVWRQNWGTEIFHPTLSRFERVWRAGVEAAMDETAKEIMG